MNQLFYDLILDPNMIGVGRVGKMKIKARVSNLMMTILGIAMQERRSLLIDLVDQ